jgi:hypothetical protein
VAKTSGAEALVVIAPLEVAWELIGDDGRTVRKLEDEVGLPVYIRADPHLERTAFDIRHGGKAEIEADYHPFRKGQMFHCRPRKARLGDRASVLMAEVDGYLVILSGEGVGRNVRRTVELTDVHRSYARGRVVE